MASAWLHGRLICLCPEQCTAWVKVTLSQAYDQTEYACKKQIRRCVYNLITIFLAWDIPARPPTCYLVIRMSQMGNWILLSLAQASSVHLWRQKLLWYLWIHSPFPWVPEAVFCMRKAVQTWANPSTSLSLLFPVCQMKLLLPFHPVSVCRCKVHVNLSLNTPKVCSSTVLYNYKYKASSWLFLLVLYLYFRILIIFKTVFPRC